MFLIVKAFTTAWHSLILQYSSSKKENINFWHVHTLRSVFVNSPPPKPEVILTNFFAEPIVLLVPITSRAYTRAQALVSYDTIIVFCWGQCKFLWTLKTIFTEAFRLRWILISKVHKNLYWPIQKTVVIVLLHMYIKMKSESETKSIRVLIKQYQILRNFRWQHDSQLVADLSLSEIPCWLLKRFI